MARIDQYPPPCKLGRLAAGLKPGNRFKPPGQGFKLARKLLETPSSGPAAKLQPHRDHQQPRHQEEPRFGKCA